MKKHFADRFNYVTITRNTCEINAGQTAKEKNDKALSTFRHSRKVSSVFKQQPKPLPSLPSWRLHEHPKQRTCREDQYQTLRKFAATDAIIRCLGFFFKGGSRTFRLVRGILPGVDIRESKRGGRHGPPFESFASTFRSGDVSGPLSESLPRAPKFLISTPEYRPTPLTHPCAAHMGREL